MPRTIATISAIEQFINETQTIQHTTAQCSLSLASSSFCSTAIYIRLQLFIFLEARLESIDNEKKVKS